MKKQKNDSTAKNANTVQAKSEKAVEQKSSDVLKIKAERELDFKKVLYGYDPEEVEAYINELSDAYETSTAIHESKISAIKEELVLSNRERDSYAEKYNKCIKGGNVPEEKNVQTVYVEKEADTQGFENEITRLKDENAELVLKVMSLEKENESIRLYKEKYTQLSEEYASLLKELELAKSLLASKEDEVRFAEEELGKKLNEISALGSENEAYMKKQAALEAENGVMSKKVQENEEEIQQLRQKNQSQAYEYAEKISVIESERTAEKLAMQKEMKLCEYYIDRAELTVAELSKQVEQMKNSLSNAQTF